MTENETLAPVEQGSGATKILDPARLFHIGVVVRNIDATVRFYEGMFGIGPFEFREINYPTATFHNGKGGYRGKRAFARLGPLTLELIENYEGKTIHNDFLDEKGEGLHHLGFEVSDFKKSAAEAQRRGLKVTQEYTREDGSGFAYFDSDKIGGVIFEVVEKVRPKT
jgi:methylmalonyl-CoA/ethylmalonyl-CoA epimerase